MRFIRRLRKLRKDKECGSLTHGICQSIINIGSVGIPALLSIQHYAYSSQNNKGQSSTDSNPIYWTAWGLSLLVGLVANYSNMFKVEEKNIIMEMTYIKLKQETWLFIARSGKYDQVDKESNYQLSHNDMFREFAYNIEKIWSTAKKQQIEAIDTDSKKKLDSHSSVDETFIKLQEA